MSRTATSEYIGTKRRAYAKADRDKRMRILDEVCSTPARPRRTALTDYSWQDGGAG